MERASTLSLLAAVLMVAAVVVFAAIKEPPTNYTSVAEDAPHMQAPAAEHTDHAHASTPEQTMWTCPMHPEVMQDHPGRCPICNMDLVPAAPAKQSPLSATGPAAEHNHAHVAADPPVHEHGEGQSAPTLYTCPMHPEVTQDHPGRCPICGMDLVPVAAAATPSASPGMEAAPAHDHAHEPAGSTAHDHGDAVSADGLWVCPMHPDVIQHEPGSCPVCGMDLVPAQQQQQAGAGVQVDTATLQRMGVRTAPAVRRELARVVRAYGTIGVDEGRVLNVTPKSEGWVRRLYVSAVGQAVKPGMPLYELYSPELLARQREYVALLQRREQVISTITDYKSQTSQVAASLARERWRTREQLAAADIDVATLKALERNYRPNETIIIRAQKAGFVTAINAREGSYVNPTSIVVTVADPRKVKIDVVLYPSQLPWIKPGDRVEVTTGAGQRAYRGRLMSVSPVVDEASRTARAVIQIDNADGRLLPGAYVDVAIATDARKTLAVPRSALMWTGDGTLVMRALGDGRFAPAPVHTGIENGEWVEITDGLEAGTQVAVNGQFLLDAAASLQAAMERMGGR